MPVTTAIMMTTLIKLDSGLGVVGISGVVFWVVAFVVDAVCDELVESVVVEFCVGKQIHKLIPHLPSPQEGYRSKHSLLQASSGTIWLRHYDGKASQ